MKTFVTSAACAAVITVVSGAVLVAGPEEIAYLALPSLPGYFLTFFLGVGPSIEGIPAPTNIAIHLLTFAVWWAVFSIALSRWTRHRAR